MSCNDSSSAWYYSSLITFASTLILINTFIDFMRIQFSILPFLELFLNAYNYYRSLTTYQRSANREHKTFKDDRKIIHPK